MSYRDDFIAYIAMDWAVSARGNRLHSLASFDVDADDWCATDATTACGRHMNRAFIPGIGTRLGMPRCARCCAATDLPQGDGSPKNDQACRRILGLETTP